MHRSSRVVLPRSTESRVVVKGSRIGRGLFAKRAFRHGEPIIKIAGRVVHYQLLWDVGGPFADNCIRFGPETYLDPGNSVGRYVNHSCEPNAAVGKTCNQLYLFAARRIASGTEIVFDYSTTIGDDDIWVMKCTCGRPSCRQTIRRFGLLPPPTRAKYLDDGLVPRFIIKTLE